MCDNSITNFSYEAFHLHLLLNAITMVNQTYISVESLPKRDNVKSYKKKKRYQIKLSLVERVFAYELYRQWANLLEKNGINDLVLNGEIRKNLISTIIPNKNFFYPDLVLHNVEVLDSNKNIIVCEIKRKESIEKISDDLLKLSMFLSNTPKRKNNDIWSSYHLGVFLLVGDTVEWSDITKKINNKIIQKIPVETKSRIYCIIYNGDGKKLEYKTLIDLLG